MTLMTEPRLNPEFVRQLEMQVRAMTDRYHAALEEMCERSLVDLEERGVLVVRSGEGWTMTLDSSVPWGMIHERLDDGGLTYGG